MGANDFFTFLSSTYKGEPDVGSCGPPKEIDSSVDSERSVTARSAQT